MDLTSALALINALPLPVRAYPNAVVTASAADPRLVPSEGGADTDIDALVDLRGAWKIQADGGGVPLAVLDTGVAYENYGRFVRHPGLADLQYVGPYDAIDGDGHANDEHQHGTHVAAIATATAGSRGTVMPVRVLDGNARGTEFTVAKGLQLAVARGARVVNLSLSFGSAYTPSDVMVEALEAARAADVVIVAAAGNDGVAAVDYPAALNGVVAVGAVDNRGVVPVYANRGSALDLVAPGGGDDAATGGIDAASFVYQRPDRLGVVRLSGTSMAAAVASGVAVLMRARHPGLSAEQVQALLEATARDLGPSGFDSTHGAGLLQASAAVEAAARVQAEPAGPLAALARGVETAVSASVVIESSGGGLRGVALISLVDEQERPLAGASVRASWVGSTLEAGRCTTDATGRCLIASSPVAVPSSKPVLFGLRIDRATLRDGRHSRPLPAFLVDVGRAEALQTSMPANTDLVVARLEASQPGPRSLLAGRHLIRTHMARSLAHARVGSHLVLAFNDAVRDQFGGNGGIVELHGGAALESGRAGDPLVWVPDDAEGTGLMGSGMVIGYRQPVAFQDLNRARFGARWDAFGSGLMGSGYKTWFLFSLSYAIRR